MKLFGAFFAVCTINGVQSANKTPYERRLTKTFDLLTDWSKSQLKGHPHFTQIREDKMSKELILNICIRLSPAEAKMKAMKKKFEKNFENF